MFRLNHSSVITITLSQLVKLLSVEKGKKGKSQLNFLVGDRVRRYLESCHRRERQLNDILRGGPDDHADLARFSFFIHDNNSCNSMTSPNLNPSIRQLTFGSINVLYIYPLSLIFLPYYIFDGGSSLQASKCMKSLKLAQKGMQSALRELAVREAREAQLGSSNKKFAFIHK